MVENLPADGHLGVIRAETGTSGRLVSHVWGCCSGAFQDHPDILDRVALDSAAQTQGQGVKRLAYLPISQWSAQG